MPDNNTENKRGEATRQALIQAGLQLFSEHGFQGTSTRMLVQRANANISAIPYHFQSKEGLYLAVVEYIGQQVFSHVAPTYQHIQHALSSDCTPAQAEHALNQLLDSLIALFVASDTPTQWALIVIREQTHPSAAFDTLYENTIKRLQHLFARLIALRVGLQPTEPEAFLRAHTLIGQLIIFISGREAILRALGVRQLTPAHLELVKRLLHAQLHATLNIPPLSDSTEH